MTLPNEAITRAGLTSITEERLRAIVPYATGRVLDSGCGPNELVPDAIS